MVPDAGPAVGGAGESPATTPAYSKLTLL